MTVRLALAAAAAPAPAGPRPECIRCGQVYLHIEMSPEPTDEPDNDVPFRCSDCGGELIRISPSRRAITYEAGSRLDGLGWIQALTVQARFGRVQ